MASSGRPLRPEPPVPSRSHTDCGQTEALGIRGLSVGVGIRRVIVRAVITGPLVGELLGALSVPVIWRFWHDAVVAAAAALAVFAAVTLVAT
ncbi:hypothetical protein EV644_14711 [Kribbella orskensis]|uniref:Uncharacterized protein n=1 Tax=Kribbella orskensis TaxID=2512216 RepID=A0ABY2B6P2_9ACTN|nr:MULTISPECIES: hypothetical protein [Kribbella]TCN27534.1 hypothetical protein EV642_16011 [Kribbella sp. VKM Ac-2500]TCO08181.1 hypothetical protein EV644_14711 [Kribbella orskensis]